MTHPSDLVELRKIQKRIRKAAGPNDVIDEMLADFLFGRGVLVNYDPVLWLERNGGWTDSIDACARLVGALLPGWWWSCGDCRREKHATVGPESGTDNPRAVDSIDGFGANVPLAILDAALTALSQLTGE